MNTSLRSFPPPGFKALHLLFGFLLLVGLARSGREVMAQTTVSDCISQEDPLRVLKQGVRKFTLSNGMRVVLFRRSHAPVFAGNVWVKVGGVNEIPGQTGVSHFLEHMAFKGTETIGTRDYKTERPLLDELDRLMSQRDAAKPDPELESRIQALYAELESLWVDNEFSKSYQSQGGVGLNAATSKDFTYYTINLPKNAFELWCWMESERLRAPVFRQFYKEREVVLEERRRGYDDSPDGTLYEALLNAAYWAHPYRLPLIGWREDVRNITPEQVRSLHRRYYRPDNIVLSLVGDLDPEQVWPKLEAYFGRLKSDSSTLPPVGPLEPQQRGPREIEVRFDAEPALALAFHKPVFPDRDDIVFTVLHSVLAEGRSSILQRELVETKKLAAAIDTTEAPGELFPSLFIVSANPAEGVRLERLRDAVQDVLDRLKRDTISEAELQAAIKRVNVNLIDALDSNSGLAGFLGKSELFWDDWRKVLTMFDMLRETSAEDLRRLALSYLTVPNRTVVMLRRGDETSAPQFADVRSR